MKEITINEALKNYLKYEKLKTKPQSYNKIKSRIKLYFIPYYNLNYNIYDYSTKYYMEYQEKIEKLNLSFKYKKIIHYMNVSFFNYCIKFYNLEKNYASIVGNFKNNEIKKEFNIWSNKEFKKFTKNIDEIELKFLYKVLFYTGIRLGEALALSWNDINFDKNEIIINKTITKEYINGKRQITTPKTKSSNRIIKIDYFLKKDLYKLKKIYNKKYINFNNDYFVFGATKPLSPTTIERKKNYYCKIANLKQIRIHDFRHSHCSILISKGIPVNLVSERLGHSNVSMTLDNYTHILNKDKKRVLKTLFLLRLF